MRSMTWFRASLPLAVLAAACDRAATGPVEGVTVNVIAAGAGSAAAAASAGEVRMDGLRLVLGGVKLETAGLDGTVDWVFAQSRVIDVDLSGEPVTAHTLLDVPAGSYKEVEISIDKLEQGNPAEEPLIAEHPALAEASIAISGRVLLDGAAESFVFTAALDRDMEIMLDPFLAIEGDGPTGVQVTLLLDTTAWFRDAEGGWLDPRDPAHRSAIEANIQKSFEAFEDGDGDGRPGPIVR